MQCSGIVLLVALVWTAKSMPLEPEVTSDVEQKHLQVHSLSKRFVNPMFTLGGSLDTGVNKMRTKRGAEDECEKLTLCKLHARSRQNFFAAFELYFVNKENARLWDHHSRKMADCERRYGDCYDKYVTINMESFMILEEDQLDAAMDKLTKRLKGDVIHQGVTEPPEDLPWVPTRAKGRRASGDNLSTSIKQKSKDKRPAETREVKENDITFEHKE